MALICMVTQDTDENGRTPYTLEALAGLAATVSRARHRVLVVDNGSCAATRRVLEARAGAGDIRLRLLGENRGLPRAVNAGLALRGPDEAFVKMDNDCVHRTPGWADLFEEVFRRDPLIGVLGPKRCDYPFRPDAAGVHRTTLGLLAPTGTTLSDPNIARQWIPIEVATVIMGTCYALSAPLLARLGAMDVYPWNTYAYEDLLVACRAEAAGFRQAYVPHLWIDHIDRNAAPGYRAWKQAEARAGWPAFHAVADAYRTGARPLYVAPDEQGAPCSDERDAPGADPAL